MNTTPQSTTPQNAAWQKYWNCYQIAVQAETAFTAETVRQFGRKNAGTMRYIPAAFDYATSCAAETKQRADNAMHSALEIARAFPVQTSLNLTPRKPAELLPILKTSTVIPVSGCVRSLECGSTWPVSLRTSEVSL